MTKRRLPMRLRLQSQGIEKPVVGEKIVSNDRLARLANSGIDSIQSFNLFDNQERPICETLEFQSAGLDCRCRLLIPA